MIKQALISVSDKRGVVDFARALQQLGYRILSTGGTARLLAEAAIPVTEVADYTGFPEMLDGRVKTLNPRIHAGLLARRPDAAHMQALAAACDRPDRHPRGEPVSVRADGRALRLHVRRRDREHRHRRSGDAACRRQESRERGGDRRSRRLRGGRRRAARRRAASEHRRGSRWPRRSLPTPSRYDGMIANYLTSLDATGRPTALPEVLSRQWIKVQQMRYGENPHQQRGVLSRTRRRAPGCWPDTRSCRARSSRTTTSPTPTRRGNACAASASAPASSSSTRIPAALRSAGCQRRPTARPSAPIRHQPSAASSRSIAPVDASAAEAVARQFVEVVIAPEFDAAARKVFARKAERASAVGRAGRRAQRPRLQAGRRRPAGAVSGPARALPRRTSKW